MIYARLFYRDFSPTKERLRPPLDAFSERISGRGFHRKRPYYIGTAEGHLSALRIEGKLSGKKRPKLASAAVLSAFLWPSALICWIEIIV